MPAFNRAGRKTNRQSAKGTKGFAKEDILPCGDDRKAKASLEYKELAEMKLLFLAFLAA